MQTRPVINVYQLNIKGNADLNFYFKSRDEAEHYLAAIFPKEVISAITEKLATPQDDEWLLLEKTADYSGCYPKTFDWARNNLAELRDFDLIETIHSNTECVFPVRLIDKPGKNQQGLWSAMFSSMWHSSLDADFLAGKEMVLDSWESENNKPLMLYVGKSDITDYLTLTSVRPTSTTFKLSAYDFNEDIDASIKVIDADLKKLAARREVELSRLNAQYENERAHLLQNRARLIAKNHELFAERSKQKVEEVFHFSHKH